VVSKKRLSSVSQSLASVPQSHAFEDDGSLHEPSHVRCCHLADKHARMPRGHMKEKEGPIKCMTVSPQATRTIVGVSAAIFNRSWGGVGDKMRGARLQHPTSEHRCERARILNRSQSAVSVPSGQSPGQPRQSGSSHIPLFVSV
jgi:hypothetical protein